MKILHRATSYPPRLRRAGRRLVVIAGTALVVSALAIVIGTSTATAQTAPVTDYGAYPPSLPAGCADGPDLLDGLRWATSTSGNTTDLAFRSCGEGCFFSPATWRDGASRLTLTPTSRIWNAKPAALAINWPARPAQDLLKDAVTAMKKVPAVTLHELVTSDTARGLGTPRSFPTTGTDFIRRALYASGQAATATRLPDDNGNRRLILSYPAENAVLELTLDKDGRILHETQTAPHHLVTRTLIYPSSHHDEAAKEQQ